MAIYSKILELQNGIPRTVDLSTNTFSVQGLQINAATGGGALTQAAHSSTTSYTIVWPQAQAASSGYALINDGAGNLSWAPASAGSVTSVALADGSTSPIYTISGSPVTSSGTLTFTLNTQSANMVLAGPTSGSAAQPTFRGLVSADIPNNAANTTGTASNITATTNSTLTTLSSLSLPYSQVTGTPTALVFADSLVNTSGTVTLVNDTASPGASQYYGTNSGSTLGYYSLPSTSGFANTALSNLASVAINTSLLPASNDAIDLGNTSKKWNNLYVGTLVTSDGTGGISPAQGKIYYASGNPSIDYVNGILYDTSIGTQLTWSTAGVDINTLLLDGSTSGKLTQKASATTTSYTVTWPAAQASGTQVLQNNGSGVLSWATASSGSVTSVGFADTSTTPIYTITNSPITGSGTIDQTLNTQSANTVFSGPSSGSAAQPSFRSLVVADFPTVNSNTGSFGSSTSIPSITVNAQGLITAASGNAVVAPAGTLSGTTLNSTVVTSSLTSLGTQASALNMGSNQINNLASPSISTDAANKGYVDAAISGLTWKGPVQSYANSNVPLTGSTPLIVDGYTVVNGDLLLLGNQTTASQNGEYSAAITGGTYALTANGLPNAAGDAWLVLDGTTYANSAFVATAAVPAAEFTEFAGPTSYIFSAPLVLTGNTVSVTQATTSTNGYLSSTDWNTFNNKQAAGNYITALTGDATASGPGSAILTLATVNSNVGTFASVTVNGKGLVTAAAALSGDATTSGSTLTFATVNSNTGSFGSSTSIPSFTVNAKGLITAASGNAVVAPAGTLSGTTLNSTVVSSSLTSVGTITSGTWNGTTIAIANGGTGQTSAAAAYNALSPMTTTGDIEYEVSANTAARLPIGSTGQVLTVVSGAPAWASPAASTGVTTILVAGQNFTSTNTTYVVRWGLTANSETANRIYACDTTTSSFDLFYAIGTISVGGSTVTTGSNATVTRLGSVTLGSSDPSLTAVGSPVYLGSGGVITQTSPSAAGTAVTRVGILSSTTTLDVSPVAVAVN